MATTNINLTFQHPWSLLIPAENEIISVASLAAGCDHVTEFCPLD